MMRNVSLVLAEVISDTASALQGTQVSFNSLAGLLQMKDLPQMSSLLNKGKSVQSLIPQAE